MKVLLTKTSLFLTQTTVVVPVIYNLLFGVVMFSPAQAADFPKLDEAVPRGYVTTDFAPVFDFDGDGCYPSCGISRSGVQNSGEEVGFSYPSKTAACTSSNFLENSNTLHRYAAITSDGSTYVGHFYALYFEKDRTSLIVPFFDDWYYGHKNDWEYAAIWTKDGVVTHVSASAHGDLATREVSSVLFEGAHPKIVYHQESLESHALRFAGTGDTYAENPYGKWVTPTITSWYELTGDDIINGDMRDLLNSFDYRDCCKDGNRYGASIPLKDDVFLANLNKEKPPSYPTFTEESVWKSNPNNPVLEFVNGDGGFSGEDRDYVLDFGTIPLGRDSVLKAEFAVSNDVFEPADTLEGIFNTEGAAPYVLTGFDGIFGLEWGNSLEGLLVEITTEGLDPGVVTGTVEFIPTGQIDSGFRALMWDDPITLTLRLTVVPPGDFDEDGDVDGNDFLKWQRGESPEPLSTADLALWQANYGVADPPATSITIPEPTGLLLIMLQCSYYLIAHRHLR